MSKIFSTLITITFIFLTLERGSSQCGNFNNSINTNNVPGTINNCNATPPSGPATICADFNISFSGGNASFNYGYIIVTNGVPTTYTFGPINTNQPNQFPDIVCVSVPCGSSITFFINAYSNPNGGGNLCNDSNATVQTQAISPLPVELTEFRYEAMKDYLELVWVTASETNNDRFSIQKSFDGIIWKEIGQVKGSANSLENIEYRYRDNELQPIAYYKLLQTDFDGRSSESHVIKAVVSTRLSEATLFPNPARDHIVIGNIPTLSHNSESAIYLITDMSGKEKLRTERLLFENEEILNISELSPGLYNLSIITSSELKNIRFYVN